MNYGVNDRASVGLLYFKTPQAGSSLYFHPKGPPVGPQETHCEEAGMTWIILVYNVPHHYYLYGNTRIHSLNSHVFKISKMVVPRLLAIDLVFQERWARAMNTVTLCVFSPLLKTNSSGITSYLNPRPSPAPSNSFCMSSRENP